MKPQLLRAAARLALERRFPNVGLGRSQGVVPGARLEYVEDGETKAAAVRTSNDREVGLLRSANADWRTVGKVQIVLVAAPAADDREQIEVLAFDPDKLVAEFDRVVAVTEKGNRNKKRFKAPVFLPLDPDQRAMGKKKSGLASICDWRDVLKKSAVELEDPLSANVAALELIKAGIAKGLGVSPERIDLSISFRIKPRIDSPDGKI